MEFRNGIGEVIKHGVICDPDLFAQLEGEGPESVESLPARALRVKIGVVTRDPFEHGERAHLNPGHTFGHAFEQVSGYAIPHGQAVASDSSPAPIWLRAAASASRNCPRASRLWSPVLGLPAHLSGLDPAAVLAAMFTERNARATGYASSFPTPSARWRCMMTGTSRCWRL